MSPGPSRTRRASIWAQDKNGVIGDGVGMLWHVPHDMRFFRDSTKHCPVIMGRGSFEAIGEPLPHRLNIVLSRDQNFTPEGAKVARTLDEAFQLAETEAERTGAKTIWVAGGGQVYDLAMSEVDELIVSYLDLEVPSNVPGKNLVYAPKIDQEIWDRLSDESDETWRPKSGDARWKVVTYRKEVADTDLIGSSLQASFGTRQDHCN